MIVGLLFLVIVGLIGDSSGVVGSAVGLIVGCTALVVIVRRTALVVGIVPAIFGSMSYLVADVAFPTEAPSLLLVVARLLLLAMPLLASVSTSLST